MNKTSKFDVFFVFFLVVFCLNFFSAKFALTGILKNISYAYMLGAIALSLPYFFRKNEGFVFPVKLICIAMLISIGMAYLSWGQGISYSLSMLPCLVIFTFFYLVHKKFATDKLEYIVLFYGSAYLLLFFFQYLHSGVVYFGFLEEFKEDRGVTRILFPGAGVFYLGYFIALNKTTENVKFRWIYIAYLVVGIIVTVLQVTRQSIALLLIITLFHYMSKASLVKKIAVVFTFSIAVLYFLNSDNPISRGLAETQKETVSDGDQYIRVLSGSYFINNFSPNTMSRIFGNGFPNNTSAYGKFTTFLEETYGYYLADVGFIGVYVMFGVLAVIGYVIILIRGLIMKVPANFIYLKYYICLLLVTCLTSNALYSLHFMITNVFVFYGYQHVCEQDKLKELVISHPALANAKKILISHNQ